MVVSSCSSCVSSSAMMPSRWRGREETEGQSGARAPRRGGQCCVPSPMLTPMLTSSESLVVSFWALYSESLSTGWWHLVFFVSSPRCVSRLMLFLCLRPWRQEHFFFAGRPQESHSVCAQLASMTCTLMQYSYYLQTNSRETPAALRADVQLCTRTRTPSSLSPASYNV